MVNRYLKYILKGNQLVRLHQETQPDKVVCHLSKLWKEMLCLLLTSQSNIYRLKSSGPKIDPLGNPTSYFGGSGEVIIYYNKTTLCQKHNMETS